MISVHVQGGTNAGTRRPFEGKPGRWACACRLFGLPVEQPAHRANCPDCGERRPG